MTTIGVVSPGAMGSALARAWSAGGARVVATIADRSPRTRSLADGLELLPSPTGSSCCPRWLTSSSRATSS